MDITCNGCGKSFKVVDEKIPAGKSVGVRCPQCKERNTVRRPEEKDIGEKPAAGAAFGFEEVTDESTYDASEKPFDFIEEEGETALICEADPAAKKQIKVVLDLMEYAISEVDDTRDALKKIRYHRYDMIVVNESFSSRSPDSNGVLIYLERLNMRERRKIFVVLLTKRFKTLDNMAAFKKSVNLVVNINDLNHFEKILSRGMSENSQFYRIYKECLHHLDTL